MSLTYPCSEMMEVSDGVVQDETEDEDSNKIVLCESSSHENRQTVSQLSGMNNRAEQSTIV